MGPWDHPMEGHGQPMGPTPCGPARPAHGQGQPAPRRPAAAASRRRPAASTGRATAKSSGQGGAAWAAAWQRWTAGARAAGISPGQLSGQRTGLGQLSRAAHKSWAASRAAGSPPGRGQPKKQVCAFPKKHPQKQTVLLGFPKASVAFSKSRVVFIKSRVCFY